MTHASIDADARAVAGISDSLLRLSVGIELAADLVQDLTRALDRVAASRTEHCNTAASPSLAATLA
jgi:cystathionine gamma-synthase